MNFSECKDTDFDTRGEIEPEVTEKHRHDNWDESFLLSTIWKFWKIKILMEGSISIVF